MLTKRLFSIAGLSGTLRSSAGPKRYRGAGGEQALPNGRAVILKEITF
jgi:hypothetical protein